MKQYLSYEEFEGDKKNIPEELFKSYQALLGRRMDYYTMHRIDYEDAEMVELVKECLVNLIVQMHDKFNGYNFVVENDGRIKKSESIGQQREDYYVPTMADIDRLMKVQERFIYREIKVYFGHTGLMYRGV